MHTRNRRQRCVCAVQIKGLASLDNASRQLAPDACEGVEPDLHSSHLSVNEHDSDRGFS